MTGAGAEGRRLDGGPPPWPPGWATNPVVDDGHEHDWVRHPYRQGFAWRCSVCHAPRCQELAADVRCVGRSGHEGPHELHPSGTDR